MTRVPDFASVEFADAPISAAQASATPWLTPEGIAVKPAYDLRAAGVQDFIYVGCDVLATLRAALPLG